MDIDLRTTAIRADAASSDLVEIAGSRTLLRPETGYVVSPVADVHQAPLRESEMVTQFVFGEPIYVYDIFDGWAWCQSANDSYVGYVDEASVRKGDLVSNSRVIKTMVHCYVDPDPRSNVRCSLPMGALLNVAGSATVRLPSAEFRMFQSTSLDFWVPEQAISDKFEPPQRFLAIATMFRSSPYLWGGKTSLGIDCSGLIQVALGTTGVKVPRDTDQQLKYFEDNGKLRLGSPSKQDIIYMPGHVCIVEDEEENVLHADGIDMLVKSEPLDDVLSKRGLTRDCIKIVSLLDPSDASNHGGSIVS